MSTVGYTQQPRRLGRRYAEEIQKRKEQLDSLIERGQGQEEEH